MNGALELAAFSRLEETESLEVQSYEEQINRYSGSEESKNLAYAFCREFEPVLLSLGYKFKPTLLDISRAVWLCPDVHKTQDVLELFTKAGLAFSPSEEDNSMYQYSMMSSQVVPRFGGKTTICVSAFSFGTVGVAVKFSFYGR